MTLTQKNSQQSTATELPPCTKIESHEISWKDYTDHFSENPWCYP